MRRSIISMALLCLSFGAVMAEENISLSNHDFDDALLSKGTWETRVSGWTVSGSAGIFKPEDARYLSKEGERRNVGYTNKGTLAQTLSENLSIDTEYTLTLEAGRRADSPQAPFTVQIVSDGQVLAQTGGYILNPGEWETVVLKLITSKAHPIGMPLEIHLISSGNQTLYDNIRLTKQPGAIRTSWITDRSIKNQADDLDFRVSSPSAVLDLAGNLQISDDVFRAQIGPTVNSSLGVEYTGTFTDNHILMNLESNGQVNLVMNDLSDGIIWKMIMNGGAGISAYTTFALSLDGTGGNEFVVNGDGDVDIRGDLTAASVTPTSDRNKKENFAEIDPNEVLNKVLAMPVTYWNYKTNNQVRHMGPVAQDFHAAFGLGHNDKGINVVDSAGVAFGAIQGMHGALVEAIAEKDNQIKQLQQKLAGWEARLEALEKQLDK